MYISEYKKNNHVLIIQISKINHLVKALSMACCFFQPQLDLPRDYDFIHLLQNHRRRHNVNICVFLVG